MPNVDAAVAYDSIMFLEAALANTETITHESARDAIEQNSKYSGIFGDLQIDTTLHEISYKLHPAKIEGEKIVYFER